MHRLSWKEKNRDPQRMQVTFTSFPVMVDRDWTDVLLPWEIVIRLNINVSLKLRSLNDHSIHNRDENALLVKLDGIRLNLTNMGFDMQEEELLAHLERLAWESLT